MTLRLKTIEFACNTNVSTLAAATKRVLSGATQIFIPESSITFKSVMLEVVVSGDNTTAGNLTVPTIGIILNAVAESTTVLQNPPVNSSLNESWQFSTDVTNYFTTNWTGTAMNWYVAQTYSTIATANHSAKITITYQYDESISDTQIKTIRIPIESTRTLLTSSFQTVGGATAIPAFKGAYLPETGVTIRQIFLDIQTNSVTTTTTNFSGQTRVDAGGVTGTPINFWRQQAALTSSLWTRSFIDITSLNLTGTTALNAISSTTNRFALFGGTVTCTYEYDSTGSTTIYNSLMLGAVDTSGYVGGPTSSDSSRWIKDIYIEEPDNITMKESGALLYFIDSTGFTFNVRVSGSTSGQSYQSYVVTSGGILGGQYSLCHRVDSGGQNGVEFTNLKRGLNKYIIDFYSNTLQVGWNLSGILILNYTSSKHTSGVGAHSHTCFQYIMSGETATRVKTSTILTSAQIPEPNYSLLNVLSYVSSNNSAPTADQAYILKCQILSGETTREGWIDMFNVQGKTSGNNYLNTIYGCRDIFYRWVGDNEDNSKLNIESPRLFRLDSSPTSYSYAGYYYTYNNILFTVSGYCYNYTGDGSGIPIKIYKQAISTSDESVLALTTTVGGYFSGLWIDDNDILYADAIQDSTHIGRSLNNTAS